MTHPDLKDIQLRPATPNQGTAAAPLIYDTDPALWNYFFSNDRQAAIQFFIEQWTNERGPFRYSLCTTAMHDKELMGIELGKDHETPITLHAEKTIKDRFKITNYLIPSIPNKAYYINFLSTSPDSRSLGLGSILLLNAFETARQAGYEACQLDVSSDNRALAFYQRHGMEIISESRVFLLEKHGVHSHYRMEKTL